MGNLPNFMLVLLLWMTMSWKGHAIPTFRSPPRMITTKMASGSLVSSPNANLVNLHDLKNTKVVPHVAWKKAREDWLLGVREVHDNYLDLCFHKFWQRTGVTCGMAAVFWGLTEALGRTWTAQGRRWLLKALFYCGTISAFPLKLVNAPVMLLFRHFSILPQIGYDSRTKMLITMVQNVLGAIPEELVYRWGVYKIWTRINKECEGEEEEDTRGVSDGYNEMKAIMREERMNRWMLWSSFLFAASRLPGLLMRPNPFIDGADGMDPLVYNSKPFSFMRLHNPFFLCLAKCASRFFMSQLCYAPLLLEGGVMASIGAHMYWNFAILFQKWQLLVRWGFGGARMLKRSIFFD